MYPFQIGSKHLLPQSGMRAGVRQVWNGRTRCQVWLQVNSVRWSQLRGRRHISPRPRGPPKSGPRRDRIGLQRRRRLRHDAPPPFYITKCENPFMLRPTKLQSFCFYLMGPWLEYLTSALHFSFSKVATREIFLCNVSFQNCSLAIHEKLKICHTPPLFMHAAASIVAAT